MPTTPTASPESTRAPLLAIAVFWLTVLLYVPTFDVLFSVSLDGSPRQFAFAAIAVAAALAAVTVGMIRYVGFRRSPLRITILLLLTSLFALFQGIVALGMILERGSVAAGNDSRPGIEEDIPASSL